MYVYVSALYTHTHTFLFGFIFALTNFCTITQELIIVLFLLFWVVHGHHGALRQRDVGSNHHLSDKVTPN